MSGAVETVDNSVENLLFNLRLDDPQLDYLSCSITNLDEMVVANNTFLAEQSRLPFVDSIVQEKKKRKRVRSRKKSKNKSETEQVVDLAQSGAIASTSNETNTTLIETPIHFSIKAVGSQCHGCAFRKRDTECQLINFEYLTNLNETYILDSREFVKLEVLNESYIIEASDKTIVRNGTTNEYDKNQTNHVKSLQSSTSQAKAKRRRQKQVATSSKEVKKTVLFTEYYKLEDVEEQLNSGALIKGTIRINPKSCKTAYVTNEDRNSQDYIINSLVDRNRALEGDVVVLKLKSESEWVDNQKSASVVYILEKVHPRIAIGTLNVFYDKRRRMAALQPRDKRVPRIVIDQMSLPPAYFKNPAEHEDILFLAKITEWENPKYAMGTIIERVGVKDDLKNETKALLLENQLDVTPFPPSVYKYLPENSAIPEGEFSYREDLRKECVFTIDPLTARDLDDAVSCKTLPNGNLEVGVHIADVSFFLNEDTELDEIVSKKGTTIYLVDNVYHMLPVELCSHCSLLPGKDSLTFSVFFEMTQDGVILSHRFARTIINSCCQLAYEHVQEMIDNQHDFDAANMPDILNEFNAKDICDIVNNLRRVSSNLRQKRFEGGALRIDQIKILFRLDKTGKPVEFFKYENMEAHRLIEELMLLANITVARKLLNDHPKIAFLRCHEPPNPRLLRETQEILENVGIHVDINSSAGLHTSLQNYCTSDYLGIARNAVLNHLLAKPMTRARYICAALEDNFEHYALAVDTYTHFTSPIRRYADVMVHRLLAASLGYSAHPEWETDYVKDIAANCNKQKYNAKKAGEASSDLFLTYYIEQNQPFIQEAVVIDVRKQSFHVLVLTTGTLVRMYLNNLGDGVKHQAEEVGKKWRIFIEYGDNTKQVIEMFQIVKVHLKRKGNTFNLEGQLIQPD